VVRRSSAAWEANRETAEHPVPRDSASWFYVFGSAALTTFGLQLVTGILLATVYVPSAGEAWNSLQVLNHDIALGWFIRALHGWGSNFMVAIVLIHMVQVFLFGAYKYPRELTWMLGVMLLLVTLGMAFTGQVLRFDQDAYWGLGIGASIVESSPLRRALAGQSVVGRPDHRRRNPVAVFCDARVPHSRAAHRVRVPARAAGVETGSQRMAGARSHRSARHLPAEYHQLTHTKGVPFVPFAVWKDILFSGFVLLSIAACAVFFGPFGPGGPPDPTIIQTAPRPDFFFLWIYAVLAFLPPAVETPLL
jgi:ubiquinol-cytochrome c reductase cytochrome b subunit